MAKSDFDSSEIKEFYNSSAKKKNNNSILIRRSARIFHLRNFNNWTKSIFINKYLKILDVNNQDLRILDLCCGKGGDQLKWLQRNVSDLTFVDISSDSVRICQERYSKLTTRNSVYSARFFVADCCVDDLASMFKGDLYDLVSCQFALHYAFESISKVILNKNFFSYIVSILFLINNTRKLIPNCFCFRPERCFKISVKCLRAEDTSLQQFQTHMN